MKRLLPFAFILCLLAGILTACSGSSSRKVSPPPCYVQMERNGVVYEEYAVQGQVWLLMEDFVAPEEAAEFLWENGARIIDAQPEIGYYLVEVQPGTEGEFVSEMQDSWEVDYVYPNAIYELQSAAPYVFDNFVGAHGKKVVEMIQEASGVDVNLRDISLYSGTQKRMMEDAVNIYSSGFEIMLANCIFTAKNKNDVVVNFSIGPGLGNHKDGRKMRWYEVEVTDSIKSTYVSRSIEELIGFNKVVKRYSNLVNLKNFVIVKAAGNEGMKNMEIIFDEIQQELSEEEYKFFKKHFLIVSAKDDHKGKNNNVDYPNDVYDGGYHIMMSKVDISDKTALDTNWCGTSFSSPRLAGYIVRASNQFNMPVTDVLKYVRKATKKALDHVIDYEMIEKEIKLAGIDPFNDLIGQTINDPSEDSFLGSKWTWKLKAGEVESVSEISRDTILQNTIKVTVLAHLLHGKMKVDATVAMTYEKTRRDSKLNDVRTLDLTIPAQTDYSQYVELKNELDDLEIMKFTATNHSNYDLFLVVDYVKYGKPRHVGFVLEQGQTGVIELPPYGWGTENGVDSYNIRFAYRM